MRCVLPLLRTAKFDILSRAFAYGVLCEHRRFSGDESFLHSPNQFNDDANEPHRSIRGNGARL